MKTTLLPLLLALLLGLYPAFAQNRPDRSAEVLFDFESGALDGWEVRGQNPLVEGKPVPWEVAEKWSRGPVGGQGNYYLDTGANSGRHTSNPDGTLISPEFTINKKYLNFYLAGELHPHVRVYLLVGNKIVREAHGNNFYDLQLRGWDVANLRNQKARFCLQDSSDYRSLIRLDHVFLSNQAPPRPEEWVKIPKREESPLVAPGAFKLIFDNQELGEPGLRVHRSTIVLGHDNRWHLFGSVSTPATQWKPEQWKSIVHASSDNLTSGNWRYEGKVLEAEGQYGEQFLWDPHVVFHEGTYYLYYVGAGNPWSGWYAPPDGQPNSWHLGNSGDQGPFRMYVATSPDGRTWERKGTAQEANKGAIFTDKPFAFTPYVHRVGDQWVMYYAAADKETVYGKHAIGYRTSPDLLTWSPRQIALKDWATGEPNTPSDPNRKPASPWPEHSFITSPVVFQRGPHCYMLAGPIDNSNLSRYHVLRVYRSDNPFRWDNHREALEQNKRIFVDGGATVIRDVDGKWYVSHGNDMAGGVWLAPLHWNDGQDQAPSSLPVPKRGVVKK